MAESATDFLAALRVLSSRRVEFIVIGGVAATLHGASLLTFDLDVIPAHDPDNLERLHAALLELDAMYREHPNKVLRPRKEDLGLPGHHLLRTRAGYLDVLGSVAHGWTFADLVDRTTQIEVDRGVVVRVLALDALIELKEAANREKDRAALPTLRRTLEQQRRNLPPKEV